MTEPFSWQALQAMNLRGGAGTAYGPSYMLEVADGIHRKYVDTDYGNIEISLNYFVDRLLKDYKNGTLNAGMVAE